MNTATAHARTRPLVDITELLHWLDWAATGLEELRQSSAGSAKVRLAGKHEGVTRSCRCLAAIKAGGTAPLAAVEALLAQVDPGARSGSLSEVDHAISAGVQLARRFARSDRPFPVSGVHS